ncbi:hypothetical protein [Kingella sp. (in: b-proteobacteria)]|uniref:hypothetical protein n=1 Tax=Kingella sp. (in: b-proteobacteria) TaxID=2020713 RepID=UPI0026DB8574|nr:hypothetical protein [Kingella sp. (in: b-proteobacteria)]MDO4657847.1 hypothetical protein [Kingella sp. (in: b-proteobacteria)]
MMWKFLLVALVIAAWLAWLRNNSMSAARFLYESVKSNPKTHEWLRQNVSGNRINDLVAIRQRFGLSLRYAVELLDEFQARR